MVDVDIGSSRIQNASPAARTRLKQCGRKRVTFRVGVVDRPFASRCNLFRVEAGGATTYVQTLNDYFFTPFSSHWPIPCWQLEVDVTIQESQRSASKQDQNSWSSLGGCFHRSGKMQSCVRIIMHMPEVFSGRGN